MHYIKFDKPRLQDEWKPHVFSGGELHFNSIPRLSKDAVMIDARVRTWEDFGFLLAFLSGVRYQSDINPISMLFLPYFPGARQDRNPDGTSPLTVEIYANCLEMLLHRLDWNLAVFDIHSLAAEAIVFDNISYVNNITPDFLDKAHFDADIDGIIAPDEGATHRAKLMATVMEDLPVVTAKKERDFSTGNIISYELDELPKGKKKWLVVDDICDGGRTFVQLSEAFRAQDVEAELQLYVSHGIFSKGVTPLLDHYDKIYTTDSFFDAESYWETPDPERFSVIPLVPEVFKDHEDLDFFYTSYLEMDN